MGGVCGTNNKQVVGSQSRVSMETARDRRDDRIHTNRNSDKLWRVPFTSATVPPAMALAYILSLLYNISFFTRIIILPHIAKSLSISDTDFGLMQTFFGVLQMVGGPVYGALIRRFGIRNALVVCYSCAIVSSLLTSAASDKVSLYVSILPSVFMHGQQGHQTLLSTITAPGKQRTNAFGRMGITFGLGFVFSPLLSLLSRKLISDSAPLLGSAAVGLIAIYVVLAHLNLDEYDMGADKKDDDAMEGSRRALSIAVLMGMAQRRGVAVTFAKKTVLITPVLLVLSILQVHMINAFGTTPEMNSLMQVLVGVLVMLNNGFVVVTLRKTLKEETLLAVGAAVFLMANLLLTQWYSLWVVFCTLPFICLGMSLVNTVADSLLTSQVDSDEQALILGASQSSNSLTRTFGPALAGYMLQHLGFAVFGVIGAVCSMLVLAYDLCSTLSPTPTSPSHQPQTPHGDHVKHD